MPTAFVTGASGFVGSAVVRELLRRGLEVRALVHRGAFNLQHERLRSVSADLFSPQSLAEQIRGCDAVIHLVGIIAENPSKGVTFERLHVQATQSVVGATRDAGVRRYLHMSALGSRPDAPAQYHQTKFRAEGCVRASGLDWTIFRPSMIHGPQGEFTRQLAGWARGKMLPYVAMPYFAGGWVGMGRVALVQPVFVEDVARAFADAMDKPQSIGRSYDIAGRERMTWPRMYRVAAEAFTGRRKMTLPVPRWYAMMLTHIAPAKWLPFNRDQVQMAGEDNTADTSGFVKDFGWEPEGFAESVMKYAKSV